METIKDESDFRNHVQKISRQFKTKAAIPS